MIALIFILTENTALSKVNDKISMTTFILNISKVFQWYKREYPIVILL